MTAVEELRTLRVRAAVLAGEADQLEQRSVRAAQRGDALASWELEQKALRIYAEFRALDARARELLEQQRQVDRLVQQACEVCVAALRGDG